MSRALSLAALAVSTGLLAACQTTGSVPAPPNAMPPSASVFRPGDFSWSAVPGKGRIEGQLAYRGSAGGRYSCSGAGVVLTPETLWSRRRMTILYNSPDRAALPMTPPAALGLQLHQCKWLAGDDEIGALPLAWNWLVGEYDFNPDARVAHFTRGGPYFPAYANEDYSDEWRAALARANSASQDA